LEQLTVPQQRQQLMEKAVLLMGLSKKFKDTDSGVKLKHDAEKVLSFAQKLGLPEVSKVTTESQEFFRTIQDKYDNEETRNKVASLLSQVAQSEETGSLLHSGLSLFRTYRKVKRAPFTQVWKAASSLASEYFTNQPLMVEGGVSANLANWFASVGDRADRASALTETGMVLMGLATEFEGTDRGEQLKLDAGKLLQLAGDLKCSESADEELQDEIRDTLKGLSNKYFTDAFSASKEQWDFLLKNRSVKQCIQSGHDVCDRLDIEGGTAFMAEVGRKWDQGSQAAFEALESCRVVGSRLVADIEANLKTEVNTSSDNGISVGGVRLTLESAQEKTRELTEKAMMLLGLSQKYAGTEEGSKLRADSEKLMKLARQAGNLKETGKASAVAQTIIDSWAKKYGNEGRELLEKGKEALNVLRDTEESNRLIENGKAVVSDWKRYGETEDGKELLDSIRGVFQNKAENALSGFSSIADKFGEEAVVSNVAKVRAGLQLGGGTLGAVAGSHLPNAAEVLGEQIISKIAQNESKSTMVAKGLEKGHKIIETLSSGRTGTKLLEAGNELLEKYKDQLRPEEIVTGGRLLVKSKEARKEFFTKIKDAALDFLLQYLPRIEVPTIKNSAEGYEYSLSHIDLGGFRVDSKNLKVVLDEEAMKLHIDACEISCEMKEIEWEFSKQTFPWAKGGGTADAVASGLVFSMSLKLSGWKDDDDGQQNHEAELKVTEEDSTSSVSSPIKGNDRVLADDQAHQFEAQQCQVSDGEDDFCELEQETVTITIPESEGGGQIELPCTPTITMGEIRVQCLKALAEREFMDHFIEDEWLLVSKAKWSSFPSRSLHSLAYSDIKSHHSLALCEASVFQGGEMDAASIKGVTRRLSVARDALLRAQASIADTQHSLAAARHRSVSSGSITSSDDSGSSPVPRLKRPFSAPEMQSSYHSSETDEDEFESAEENADDQKLDSTEVDTAKATTLADLSPVKQRRRSASSLSPEQQLLQTKDGSHSRRGSSRSTSSRRGSANQIKDDAFYKKLLEEIMQEQEEENGPDEIDGGEEGEGDCDEGDEKEDDVERNNHLQIEKLDLRIPVLQLEIAKSWFSKVYNILLTFFADSIRVYIEWKLNEIIKENAHDLVQTINEHAEEYLPLIKDIKTQTSLVLKQGKQVKQGLAGVRSATKSLLSDTRSGVVEVEDKETFKAKIDADSEAGLVHAANVVSGVTQLTSSVSGLLGKNEKTKKTKHTDIHTNTHKRKHLAL